MADSRVAARYIKSLIGLAVEQKALDQVHNDMLLFDQVCKGSRQFVIMLRSPLIKHETKRAVLRKLFTGKVNKLTLAMIDIITHKNRESLLPQIASDFHAAYNVHMGIVRAEVTTTVPMHDSLRKSVEAIVKNLSQRDKVEIEEKVDKDLIGGFVLQVGDKQIDASVKGKLRTLRTAFESDQPVLANEGTEKN